MNNHHFFPRRSRLNYSPLTIKYLLYYSSVSFIGNSSTQLFPLVGSHPASGSCFLGGGSRYDIIARKPLMFSKVHIKQFNNFISSENKNMNEFAALQSSKSEVSSTPNENSVDKQQYRNNDVHPAKSNKNSIKSKKKNAKNIKDSDGDFSLAHLASSSERFSASLGMTAEQVTQAIDARRAASSDFHKKLVAITKELETKGLSAQEIGKIKHEMICRHRYENLRNPFVCRKCWTHIPICVCPQVGLAEDGTARGDEKTNQINAGMTHRKSQLPKGVERVVVWTHHDEWGKTSNTGSLLPLALQRTEMLMKGLKEHEEIMNDLINRRDLTPVVLWPGKRMLETDSRPYIPYVATTISELRQQILVTPDEERNQDGIKAKRGIVLISIEGSWNNARKMVNKLPTHVLRLDLGEEIAMNNSIFVYNSELLPPTSSSPSLLAPLRRQGKGKDGWASNVSTLEATVIGLLALGLPKEEASCIIALARSKVDRIRHYTGRIYSRP